MNQFQCYNAENDCKLSCSNLHMAASKLHISCIIHLLSNKSYDELKDYEGEILDLKNYTPLHLAVCGTFGIKKGSSFQCAKYLLENGASVNEIDLYKNTPLHQLAQMGDAETAKLLFQSGANLYLLNHFGETCLMLSVLYDNIQVFQLILEQLIRITENDKQKIKNYINLQNHHGDTALILSIRAQDGGECGKLLLEYGADINIENNEGYTAYDYVKCKEIYFLQDIEHHCLKNNICALNAKQRKK